MFPSGGQLVSEKRQISLQCSRSKSKVLWLWANFTVVFNVKIDRFWNQWDQFNPHLSMPNGLTWEHCWRWRIVISLSTNRTSHCSWVLKPDHAHCQKVGWCSTRDGSQGMYITFASTKSEPGFETQRTCPQKSKTLVPVAPKFYMCMCPRKTFKKQGDNSKRLRTTHSHSSYDWLEGGGGRVLSSNFVHQMCHRGGLSSNFVHQMCHREGGVLEARIFHQICLAVSP